MLIKKPHHKLLKYLKNIFKSQTRLAHLFIYYFTAGMLQDLLSKPAILKLSLSNFKHSQPRDLQQNEHLFLHKGQKFLLGTV